MMGLSVAVTGQALIHTPVKAVSDAAVALQTDLQAADVTMGNFEATLQTPSAWPLKTKTVHAADPNVMQSLKQLGFDALSLANNHAFDLGPQGVVHTRQSVLDAGMAAAGSGEDATQASQAALVTRARGRVALLAFDVGPQPEMVYARADSPGINPLRLHRHLMLPPQDLQRLQAITAKTGYSQKMNLRQKIGFSDPLDGAGLDFYGLSVLSAEVVSEHLEPHAADLENARQAIQVAALQAEVVAVSLHYHHWEVEWTQTPDWLDRLTKTLVDAGADLVFCHGPPVLQGMRLYQQRPIFYGLGNLIFQTHRAPRYDDQDLAVWSSLVARCEFNSAHQCSAIHLYPIAVGRPIDALHAPTAPEYLLQANAQSLIADWLNRCCDFSGCRVLHHDRGCSLRLNH